MRILFILLCCTSLFGAETYRELRKECRDAYRIKDFPKLYRLAEEAWQQRPDDVGGILNLALASALTNRLPRAVKLLHQLADRGLVYNLPALPLHKPLATYPGYQDLLKRFDANKKPVTQATTAFTLPTNDFYPEGIAHDPKTGTFYVGSVHHRRIDRIDATGKVTPFVVSAHEGLWSVMGLAVSNGELLVCSAALEQTRDLNPEEKGRSGLFRFNLADGTLKSKHLLIGGNHNLGDLLLADKGLVYLSDGTGGGVYTLKPGQQTPVLLVKHPDLVSPQGMALSKDGGSLYIADWTYGLFVYHRASKKLKRVTPAKPAVLKGIDGLVRHGDYLIGIQNGIQPNRVTRWKLSLDGGHVTDETVLEAGNPVFDEPTLGTLVGDQLYFVATSHWPRYDKNRPMPADKLSPIHILKLNLKTPR